MEQPSNMASGDLIEMENLERNCLIDLNKELRVTLLQELDEKNVEFIIENGEKYKNDPDILAMKLSISESKAMKALDILKSHAVKKVTKDEIMKVDQLVKEHSNLTLEKIALLHDISQVVISVYLEHMEKKALTDSQKSVMKEKYNKKYSVEEIANQMGLSQMKVREYVEKKCITFSGLEGQRVLEIIAEHFDDYPIQELRGLIASKDIKLQEQLLFQLPDLNEKDYKDLKQYFDKFEASRNFFLINESLNIRTKEYIRTSNYDDIEKLSIKLNRVPDVIRKYRLLYHPDKSLMLHYSQEQLKQTKFMFEYFETTESIPHHVYRMIITEPFDRLFENSKFNRGQPKILLNRLLPMVFYYIKCSLPLEEISMIISRMISKISLTALDLFHLIFQMSDPIVRGLCIEHYSFSNPVPLYYPKIKMNKTIQTSCNFEICSELWYSGKQFNGIVSFGLGWASWNPVGKSHLLDLMFETDFVKGSPQESAFHFGSIDIQMTKNLFGKKNNNERTDWAYIDCHSYSDDKIVKRICQNLDIALIQVDNMDFCRNSPELEQELLTLTHNTQHVYVLIRDCPGSTIEIRPNRNLLKGKLCHIIHIPNLIKQIENIRADLKSLGYQIIHSESSNIKLINSIFMEQILRSDVNLVKENELIFKIVKHIQTKEGSEDFSSLSHYPHFIEYMRCYYKASKETDQKVVDDLNKQHEELDKRLSKAKKSEIVSYLNEIISCPNSTLILWRLAEEMRISASKYTLEILWREALLAIKYHTNKGDNKPNKFSKEFAINFSNHVKRGEPFELIDGDNLRFFNQDINALLSKFNEKISADRMVYKNENRDKPPPIVISIFGPQSSGKSTLLNYCFGCKFLTSAGRCTKGVYASLSKLSQPINHSDHFLILDTEGLDAIEKGNILKETDCIEFDRTMVLFCLAVSQVVIINVKGDIGEDMRNLLQICAYSLNKLKVSKVPAPKIFFVLNQQADPDPQKHLTSINTLLENLTKESYLIEELPEGVTISDLINISKDNLFVLPSAFNSFCVNSPMAKLFKCDLNKLSPTSSFANKCADLRMSIINQLKEDFMICNHRPFTTLSEWLEMSGVIWDTIVKYQDIVKYRNVDELKCSISLSNILSSLLKNKIYYYKRQYLEITDESIEEIKKMTSLGPANVILANQMRELDETFAKYQEEALKEFEKRCRADSLLMRHYHMCDDARSNLRRLIYIEKKNYEDKIRFEIKARLTEIKQSENMMKFQSAIERKIDMLFDSNTEERKKEFETVWQECFRNENDEQEYEDRIELFDNLYSVFAMESKSMEIKQTIYACSKESDFNMDTIISKLREDIINRFSGDPNTIEGNKQFLYHWRENKAPIKDMTPYPGKEKCEYLSKEALWIPSDEQNMYFGKNPLNFQEWVPESCFPLLQYCSGHYNHPDIIWKTDKRKQVLILASQLKDPDNFHRSTWEKFMNDIDERVEEFIRRDPTVSQGTVKEIVSFLCCICREINYEINYIEVKLTNAAERTISTYAFVLAFKSLLELKIQNHKESISEENKKKEMNFKYFFQKIEFQALTRGKWERETMREGDRTIANKFAQDLLEALWRKTNVACERIVNAEYFDRRKEELSHKNLILLANKKIKAELSKDVFEQLDIEENWTVQFICNQTQTLKNLFKQRWLEIAEIIHDRIVGRMKMQFSKDISLIKNVFIKLYDSLVSKCASSDRPEDLGLDSDSNFIVTAKESTLKNNFTLENEDSEMSTKVDARTNLVPFKATVLFLKMYLDPKLTPEEFNDFFNNPFNVDDLLVQKNDFTYVLCEKSLEATGGINQELFEMITSTKMFNSTETIFNIKIYVEEFLCTLNCYEFQVTQTDYDNILKASKEKFETRVINCPYQCPSCGKFCEREIHPHEGKCQILTGHQICSMGGKVWKNDKDKTAVLLMCEDYKENSPVVIPGQNMKWWEFKEKCGEQWDWELPKDKVYSTLQRENREKMKNIWNKFGREILRYYANKGIRINYISYTSAEEIYETLFSLNSCVCFLIDATNRMGGTICYIKNWVLGIIKELEGSSYFKIVSYHGDDTCKDCVRSFPAGPTFTSNEKDIQQFLDRIYTYGDDKKNISTLHGLATAITRNEWKSGSGITNTIVHYYVEPTNGRYNPFEVKGRCRQKKCSFDWKKDIHDKMEQINVKYKSKRLISHSHPDSDPGRSINFDSPNVPMCSGNISKNKTQVFINYKHEY